MLKPKYCSIAHYSFRVLQLELSDLSGDIEEVQ
jgi:hypothetical protein